MTATSTFCFPTTTIKDGLSLLIDRPAGRVSSHHLRLNFGKSKPQTTNLRGCLCSVVPAFLHHCKLRYVNVMTGYRSHLVMGGGLGKSCFHCCSVWLHCCTESDRGWPKMLHAQLLKPHWLLLYCSFISDLKHLSGYLDPRRRRQPYEPSWPGFPRSPASTPHSTAGATGPWKTLITGFRWYKKHIQICSVSCSQWSHPLIRDQRVLLYTLQYDYTD